MKKLWVNERDYITLSDAPRRGTLTEEIATRNRSIDFYALGMYLPNPDPVLKKMGKDITVYSEILSDAHLGGCASSRRSGVRSLEWGIDRGKAKSRQAALIEEVFKALDIDGIFDDILKAPLYGYQPLEVIWEKVGDRILPKAVVGKPPEWFVFDDENRFRFRTKENSIYGELVPERKFLVPTNGATYQNPYGFPELSRCFWPVTFKKGGMKFWVIFTEKYGMPFIVGKHPRGTGKTDTDNLADMLEQMVQDAVAVVPDDSSVEIMEASGKAASADIYQKLLEYCDKEISIAILGQNLTTEVKGGSYAAAQSHMAVRQDIVDGDRRLVESVFNELIRWIYELNFGGVSPSALPRFSMWEEEDVDLDQATRDKALSDTGQVKFSKKYFMKTYGFEEEDFEVSAEKPPVSPGGAQLPLDRSNMSYRTYAEGFPRYPDQDAVDAAAAAFSPKELQKQAEGILRPVIEMIEEGHTYQQILDRLAETFPKMDDAALQEMLTRAVFVSEVWGRLSAQEE
jgi:phage gp29-like protein